MSFISDIEQLHSQRAEILEAVDVGLDTNLRGICEVAEAISPGTGDIAIAAWLDTSMLSALGFGLSTENTPWTLLTLGTTEEDYREFVSGIAQYRMPCIRGLLDEAGIEYTWKRSMEIVLAHELGHGDELLNKIATAPDAAKAVIDYSAATTGAYQNLPLGRSTIAAKRDYIDNPDSIYRALFTKNEFNRALVRNVLAYNELPIEKHADDFALKVMQALYA